LLAVKFEEENYFLTKYLRKYKYCGNN